MRGLSLRLRFRLDAIFMTTLTFFLIFPFLFSLRLIFGVSRSIAIHSFLPTSPTSPTSRDHPSSTRDLLRHTSRDSPLCLVLPCPNGHRFLVPGGDISCPVSAETPCSSFRGVALGGFWLEIFFPGGSSALSLVFKFPRKTSGTMF